MLVNLLPYESQADLPSYLPTYRSYLLVSLGPSFKNWEWPSPAGSGRLYQSACADRGAHCQSAVHRLVPLNVRAVPHPGGINFSEVKSGQQGWTAGHRYSSPYGGLAPPSSERRSPPGSPGCERSSLAWSKNPVGVRRVWTARQGYGAVAWFGAWLA